MKITKAVIPVAGKGTRFLPVTKEIPKEMLPLLRWPMIHYIVEEAIGAGIEEIVFVTSGGKSAIENYFDRNLELERFLRERNKLQDLETVRSIGEMVSVVAVRQKEQLGLGHAILCARGVLEGGDFAVLLGDELIFAKPPGIKQLMEVYDRQNCSSVVGVVKIDKNQSERYGIAVGESLDEMSSTTFKLREMVEKPSPAEAPSNLATPGRYILTGEIFDILKKIPEGSGGEYQLTDAINILAANSEVYAHLLDGERYDTGSVEGCLDATLELALDSPQYGEMAKRLIRQKVLKYSL